MAYKWGVILTTYKSWDDPPSNPIRFPSPFLPRPHPLGTTAKSFTLRCGQLHHRHIGRDQHDAQLPGDTTAGGGWLRTFFQDDVRWVGFQMSNEKNPFGCFLKWWYPPKHPKMIIFSRKTHGCWVPPFIADCIGDYTTQLYGDFHKPL